MKNRVQPQAFTFLSKHYGAELCSINCAVIFQDIFSESFDDGLQTERVWGHYFASCFIGVEYMATEFGKDSEDERLADGNRARETDFEHGYKPRRHFAA